MVAGIKGVFVSSIRLLQDFVHVLGNRFVYVSA